MEKRFVSIKELANLLNTGPNTFTKSNELNGFLDKYCYEQREKNNEEIKGRYIYKIDLDELLLNSKLNTFKFEFEYNNTSFLDRTIKRMDFSKYPEKMYAKDVKKMTGWSSFKLKTARERGYIQYIDVSDSIEKKHSQLNYIYIKSSILDYMSEKGEKKDKLEFDLTTPQFYKISKVSEILSKVLDKNVSIRRVYDYIHKQQIVPAVKVGGNIRIPILEFENYLKKIK